MARKWQEGQDEYEKWSALVAKAEVRMKAATVSWKHGKPGRGDWVWPMSRSG